jgi:hypothetical protein
MGTGRTFHIHTSLRLELNDRRAAIGIVSNLDIDGRAVWRLAIFGDPSWWSLIWRNRHEKGRALRSSFPALSNREPDLLAMQSL